MSYDIEKLREIQNFTPYAEWDNTINTNCIAYALGLMVDDPKHVVFGPLLCGTPIENLQTVFEQLGFTYRRINTPSDLENGEYGIVLYHYFYEGTVRRFGFDCQVTFEETHLARIEPDGTWTHKFGWDYPSSVTTPEEIHKVILEDDNVDVSPTAFFAVRKSQ